jgi:hypothetical protein
MEWIIGGSVYVTGVVMCVIYDALYEDGDDFNGLMVLAALWPAALAGVLLVCVLKSPFWLLEEFHGKLRESAHAPLLEENDD